MKPTIIVCVNRRRGFDQPSCAGRGSEAIADALDAGLAVASGDEQGAIVRIKCFGRCAQGPLVRIAPGGQFFTDATLDDVPTILEALSAQGTTRD